MAEIENPKKREWFRIALEHGHKFDSWFEVKPHTAEMTSWLEYFGRLGWTPITLTQVERNKEKSWSAPCQWPSSLGRIS